MSSGPQQSTFTTTQDTQEWSNKGTGFFGKSLKAGGPLGS